MAFFIDVVTLWSFCFVYVFFSQIPCIYLHAVRYGYRRQVGSPFWVRCYACLVKKYFSSFCLLLLESIFSFCLLSQRHVTEFWLMDRLARALVLQVSLFVVVFLD